MYTMKFRWMVVCVVCCAFAASSGCDEDTTSGVDPADATDAPYESEASKQWKMPTDEECRKFAEALESAAASGNGKAMEKMFDWTAILERATGGIKGVDKSRRQFIAGAKQSLQSKDGLGHQIVSAIEGDGSYRFLRVRSRGGRKSILFRMLISDDGGMNYHDMIVVKRPDGKLRIIDVYVFLTAEMISSTFRRSFIPLAAGQNRSILQKLSGEESDYVKHFKKIVNITTALRSKQFRRVLQIYDRLPASLQKEINTLIMRLQAAQGVDEEEYKKAIDAFRRHHPDDPCIDILSLDKYIIDEKFADALDSVDRIDRSVGGDPHLDVLRANLYMLKDDFAHAKKRAERAIKAEPTLIEAYWALVAVSLAEPNFEETTRLLRLLNDKFEIEFDDLTTVPEYSEYVKSPQHREWLESRKGK